MHHRSKGFHSPINSSISFVNQNGAPTASFRILGLPHSVILHFSFVVVGPVRCVIAQASLLST